MRISKRYYLLWVSLWCAYSLLLVAIDLRAFSRIAVEKDFSENQFALSVFFPLGRTVLNKDSQDIVDEPVYFSVYAPNRYDRAHVMITTEGPPSQWKLGIKVGPGFSFSFKELDSAKTSQRVTFDMNSTTPYYESNRLRFILAHPEEMGSPLRIRNLNVTLDNDYSVSFARYLGSWNTSLSQTYENIF